MSLNKTEKAVLEAFKRELAWVLNDSHLQVTVFGSKARGDDQSDSDVDVLIVVSNPDWRVADQVYEVATRVLLDTGVLISPKVVSESRYAELLDREAPFAMNVLRDGVTV